jgi:hypothetical protein
VTQDILHVWVIRKPVPYIPLSYLVINFRSHQ